jgi:single-strand DNA-binding protein
MANDLNTLAIIGRLTREPELKYAQSGTAILNGSIAVNRRTKKNDQWVDKASFFDFSYMGKGAEAVSKFLAKGKRICLDGELTQDTWEKDGQPQSKIKIMVDNLILLDGKSSEQSTDNSQSNSGQFEDDVPF